MANFDGKAPGVYVEEITPAGPIAGVGTSTAAFIGQVVKSPPDAELGVPFPITNWTQYTGKFGDYKAGLNLPFAVRGCFENGGTLAYVVPVKDNGGIAGALEQLTRVADVSIVCLPGVVDPAQQKPVLDHCEAMGNRFAILDGVPDADPQTTAAGPAGRPGVRRAGTARCTGRGS